MIGPRPFSPCVHRVFAILKGDIRLESAKVAWLELQKTKQEISKAFDAAVVDMNDTR